MGKKCQVQHASKISKVCTKEHKQLEAVTGNKNDDTTMLPKTKRLQCDCMKEYMQQRWQDPKYHIEKAKQERWQDPKYHTDESKPN